MNSSFPLGPDQDSAVSIISGNYRAFIQVKSLSDEDHDPSMFINSIQLDLNLKAFTKIHRIGKWLTKLENIYIIEVVTSLDMNRPDIKHEYPAPKIDIFFWGPTLTRIIWNPVIQICIKQKGFYIKAIDEGAILISAFILFADFGKIYELRK